MQRRLGHKGQGAVKQRARVTAVESGLRSGRRREHGERIAGSWAAPGRARRRHGSRRPRDR